MTKLTYIDNNFDKSVQFHPDFLYAHATVLHYDICPTLLLLGYA